MITKTIIPKSKTNDAYFRYEVAFDGDCSKTYTCTVVNSNLPTPKFAGFTTRENGQNYIILEFEARCNNTEMIVQFNTVAEMLEKRKFEFIKWLLGYLTWFNFIFRIFKVETLKKITKVIIVGIAIPVVLSIVYASIEFGYESYTGDNFEDSQVVEYWSNFTIPEMAKWFKDEAPDKLGDLKDYLKEGSGDIIEATKEKAGDIKEGIVDKYEDIKD